MAKPKTKQSKPKRKTSSKYGKLLAVAVKELAAKKKALIQAERNLARAKQKHEDLISEVARLDMVERSLRAMAEGTEPPTNIKYVYQYPQWVWYPYQQYVYYTWPPQQGNGYWYNGQWTTPPYQITTACQNLDTAGNTVYTTANAGSVNATNLTSGVSNFTTDTGGLILTSTACSSLPSASSGASLNTLVNNVNFTNASADAGVFVVDLSTGAEATDAGEKVEPEQVETVTT